MIKNIGILLIILSLAFGVTSCKKDDGNIVDPNTEDQLTISQLDVITWFEGNVIRGTCSYNTNFPAKTILEYDTNPDDLRNIVYDTLSFIRAHTLPLENLANLTEYSYVINAWTSDSLMAQTEIITFQTPDSANMPHAPAISQIEATDATRTGITINWVTDVDADSKVFWGEEADALTDSTSDAEMADVHAIEIDQLAQGMVYYFKVASMNEAGYRASSGVMSFRTLGSPDDSLITNARVDYVTNSTVGISWVTNTDSDTRLIWGLDSLVMDSTKMIVESRAVHSIKIKDLEQATVYYFQVFSEDIFGYMRYSDTLFFITSNIINLVANDTSMVVDGRLAYPFEITEAADIAGIGMTIQYDFVILKVDSVKAGPFFLNNNPDFFRATFGSGEIRIDMNWHLVYDGNIPIGTNADGAGIFCYVYFTALRQGVCPIEYSPDGTRIYDVNAQVIQSAIDNGEITVE